MADDRDDIGEIDIPAIEIDDGWMVDDLDTVDDCDDATIKVNAIIAEIEFQIEIRAMRPQDDAERLWAARARRALKYKRIAAQAINVRKGRFNNAEKVAKQSSHDRTMLDVIKAAVPRDQWHQWAAQAELYATARAQAA